MGVWRVREWVQATVKILRACWGVITGSLGTQKSGRFIEAPCVRLEVIRTIDVLNQHRVLDWPVALARTQAELYFERSIDPLTRQHGG